MQRSALVMILAGGEGSRLRPLTLDRAKPAVPFGGRYRIIDFALSNFINSGFYRINVITQYKSDSLGRHIARGWRMAGIADHYVDVVPAQQRTGKHWYMGSADAVFQNLNLIEDTQPKDVCVFGGDHIYKMDVRQMLSHHREIQASLTIAAIPVPLKEASAFGVMEVDAQGRVVAFEEKPDNPKPMPHRPTHALVSMGNYIFERELLCQQLVEDARDDQSSHDFGKDILPGLIAHDDHRVFAYDFSTNELPGHSEREQGYWKDVGTIESYWRASMDLIEIVPEFNLYNSLWPVRTYYEHFPPAKFVHNDATTGRVGTAANSLVSEGCIVSGAKIVRSVLFPQVRTHSYAQVEESVLFHEVTVGRHARIRRAIIDKGVTVPPYTQIGYDLELDRQRFHVSPEGIVVVGKGTHIAPTAPPPAERTSEE